MKIKLANILEEISLKTSTLEKIEVLKKNFYNEELKQLLNLALNPYKNYQVNILPCKYQPLNNQSENFKHFKILLDNLNNRIYSGSKAKKEIINVFKLFDEQSFKWYSKVITGKAIGIGESTVNKVWPNLIPSFKVMLAPSDLPNLTKLKYPIYVQPKIDGYRTLIINGEFYTRTGKKFGNKNLKEYFKNAVNYNSLVLDGELYCPDQDFNKLQSILNNHNNPLPNSLKYVIYDAIPLKDWEAQTSKKHYTERIKALREAVNAISDYKRILDCPTDLVNSPSEVLDLYKQYLAKGYEGVMLKAPTGLYRWKRVTLVSQEMVKLKPFETLDLTVTGFFEGEGALEGSVGGIVVDFNGNSVRVGSGFTLEDRQDLKLNPNKYLGKIAEIKYFEETDNSLRHPVFIRWRFDK